MDQLIGYNEFKFNAILSLRVPRYAELEYDRQFDVLPSLYDLFSASIFNDYNVCEWECMENFLRDEESLKWIDAIIDNMTKKQY